MIHRDRDQWRKYASSEPTPGSRQTRRPSKQRTLQQPSRPAETDRKRQEAKRQFRSKADLPVLLSRRSRTSEPTPKSTYGRRPAYSSTPRQFNESGYGRIRIQKYSTTRDMSKHADHRHPKAPNGGGLERVCGRSRPLAILVSAYGQRRHLGAAYFQLAQLLLT